jgi:hypothetical protein
VVVDLFEYGPELGSGTLGGAVGEVEELLNAVLLRTTFGLGAGDALDTLVKVMLGG